jgi:hypothetical protein
LINKIKSTLVQPHGDFQHLEWDYPNIQLVCQSGYYLELYNDRGQESRGHFGGVMSQGADLTFDHETLKIEEERIEPSRCERIFTLTRPFFLV